MTKVVDGQYVIELAQAISEGRLTHDEAERRLLAAAVDQPDQPDSGQRNAGPDVERRRFPDAGEW